MVNARSQHLSQNEDVRYLGRLLGDVIRAYGGEELFHRTEYIRRASVDRHRGFSGADAVDTGLDRLSLDDTHRSGEHTSELQSLMRISYAVFCLKKNNTVTIITF